MGIIAKIYPNGEASLYYERMLKKKNFKSTPKQTDRSYLHYLDAKEEHGHEFALQMQNEVKRGGRPLGLVTAPISTKNPKTLATCKGLTRHGARMLRQGAFIIEQSAGKDQVTFATATLPALTDDELAQVEATWSQIVHRFVKRIRYELTKKGLPSQVIHVTEVQTKRAQNEGREMPHLHLVFQGRKRKSSWAITPAQITRWWAKSLQLRRITRKMCSTTCQLARVKSSVSRYLSKYVAKSASKTSDATCSSTYRKLSLKQWWGCTNSLKKLIFLNTTVLSGSLPNHLWRMHEKNLSSIWEYLGTIESTGNGVTVIFCRFGRLTKWARQKYLRPNLDNDPPRTLRSGKPFQGLTYHDKSDTLRRIDTRNAPNEQLLSSVSGCGQERSVSGARSA